MPQKLHDSDMNFFGATVYMYYLVWCIILLVHIGHISVQIVLAIIVEYVRSVEIEMEKIKDSKLYY